MAASSSLMPLFKNLTPCNSVKYYIEEVMCLFIYWERAGKGQTHVRLKVKIHHFEPSIFIEVQELNGDGQDL